MASCHGCKQSLSGQTVTVESHDWHVNCWKCQECGKPFFNGATMDSNYHKGQAIVCLTCAKTGTKCETCKDTIDYTVERGVVSALGVKFHHKCFVCAVCRKGIEAGHMKIYSPQPTTPYCDVCKFPLDEEEEAPAASTETKEGKGDGSVADAAAAVAAAAITTTAPKAETPKAAPKPVEEPAPKPAETHTATGGAATGATGGAAGGEVKESRAEMHTEVVPEDERPTCGGCSKRIDGPWTTALDKSWHAECFTCLDCSASIAKSSFFPKRDRAVCPACNEKSAPTCHSCKKNIVGRTTLAMDKSWHPECFVCYGCKKPFMDGSYAESSKFPGFPLCDPCSDKEDAED